MTPLSHDAHVAVLDCIHALHGCRSLTAFPAHALAAIGTLVPNTLAAFNEVNLRLGRTTMVMDRPIERPEHTVRTWNEHREAHPLFRYVTETGDGQAIKISDFLTTDEFHRLDLYDAIYAPLGTEDQMSLTIRSDAGVVIAVALNRAARDFTEADRVKLNLVRPHLLQAYANVEELTQRLEEKEDLQTALRETGHGLVAIDTRNRIAHATPGAPDVLRRFFPDDGRPEDALPSPVAEWIASEPESPFSLHSGNDRLILRSPRQTSRRLLLLSEERYTPLREPLTPRELNVLEWLAQGKSNAVIATILGVASGTVKLHVQSIFTKLGVGNRTAAANAAREHGLLRSRR